jgi:hypothetical protein
MLNWADYTAAQDLVDVILAHRHAWAGTTFHGGDFGRISTACTGHGLCGGEKR